MDFPHHKKGKYLTMDSKKVHALLLAVEKGSLTAAAAELGYTQSGLTHMMNALEDELGLNLLVRSKNGVHLSPAGQALQHRMQALLSAAEDLERDAEHLRQRSYTTLRLGAYSSIASTWLPAILSSFRKIDPNTEVVIDVGGVPDTYAKLRDDRLDCALLSYQESLCQGLTYIHLSDDPLVAILPEKDSHRGSFPVEEFVNTDFLMPSDGFDMDIIPFFNHVLGKKMPHIRYTNLSDSAIVSMVEHNLGVSLLSELIMKEIQSPVTVLPLDPPVSRKLGIAVSERHQNDKVIRRFIHCSQMVVADLTSSERSHVV